MDGGLSEGLGSRFIYNRAHPSLTARARIIAHQLRRSEFPSLDKGGGDTPGKTILQPRRGQIKRRKNTTNPTWRGGSDPQLDVQPSQPSLYLKTYSSGMSETFDTIPLGSVWPPTNVCQIPGPGTSRNCLYLTAVGCAQATSHLYLFTCTVPRPEINHCKPRLLAGLGGPLLCLTKVKFYWWVQWS